MDEAVRRAIAKWPNVPAVFGWLSLDRRGRWHIKGEVVGNATVVDFINRNYLCDEQGRWFFQNGPQRVFVALSYTPLIYRLAPDGEALVAHTGKPARALRGAWLDEHGSLLLLTELGIGLVHDHDLDSLLPRLTGPDGETLDGESLLAALEGSGPVAGRLELALAGARIRLQPIDASAVPQTFGFNPDPRPAPGEPDC